MHVRDVRIICNIVLNGNVHQNAHSTWKLRKRCCQLLREILTRCQAADVTHERQMKVKG